jgi:hypothetical protein
MTFSRAMSESLVQDRRRKRNKYPDPEPDTSRKKQICPPHPLGFSVAKDYGMAFNLPPPT